MSNLGGASHIKELLYVKSYVLGGVIFDNSFESKCDSNKKKKETAVSAKLKLTCAN